MTTTAVTLWGFFLLVWTMLYIIQWYEMFSCGWRSSSLTVAASVPSSPCRDMVIWPKTETHSDKDTAGERVRKMIQWIINRRSALRVSSDKGTGFTRNKLGCHNQAWREKKATKGPCSLQPEDAGSSKRWEGQWLFNKTHFSSVGRDEQTEKRQFPLTLLKPCQLSLSERRLKGTSPLKLNPTSRRLQRRIVFISDLSPD